MRRLLIATLTVPLPAPGFLVAQVRLSMDLTLTCSARLRHEGWGRFDTGLPAALHNHRFFAAQTHVALDAAPVGWMDGRLDVQNTLQLRTPQGAIAAPPVGDLNLGATSLALSGTFGFSHVARSGGGATGAVDPPRWNLTALAARPRRGGSATDGMKQVTELDVAGTAASAATELHQVGGHLVPAIPPGTATVALMGWGVIQKGDWGAMDHPAWAAAVEARVQGLNPRVRAGYLRTSGDDDPADPTHETFFQTLTTVCLYAQSPFDDLMHSGDLFAQVVLRPLPGKPSLRGDPDLLRHRNESDLRHAGSGATARSLPHPRASVGLRGPRLWRGPHSFDLLRAKRLQRVAS